MHVVAEWKLGDANAVSTHVVVGGRLGRPGWNRLEPP